MFQLSHARYKKYLSFPQKLCLNRDPHKQTYTHTNSHNDTLLLSLAEQAQIKSIQTQFLQFVPSNISVLRPLQILGSLIS
jgi:hypothetical protein